MKNKNQKWKMKIFKTKTRGLAIKKHERKEEWNSKVKKERLSDKNEKWKQKWKKGNPYYERKDKVKKGRNKK